MYGTVAAADGRVSGATAAAAAECMCGGVIIQHFMPLPEFRPPPRTSAPKTAIADI